MFQGLKATANFLKNNGNNGNNDNISDNGNNINNGNNDNNGDSTPDVQMRPPDATVSIDMPYEVHPCPQNKLFQPKEVNN
jgi:hypothetical protein